MSGNPMHEFGTITNILSEKLTLYQGLKPSRERVYDQITVAPPLAEPLPAHAPLPLA